MQECIDCLQKLYDKMNETFKKDPRDRYWLWPFELVSIMYDCIRLCRFKADHYRDCEGTGCPH